MQIISSETNKNIVSEEKFFKDFYFSVAKKNTHPDLVFSIFSKMIINNNAVLVKVIHNMEVAAYVLIVTYKYHA